MAHIKLQCRRGLNKYKRITNTLSVQYEGDKTWESGTVVGEVDGAERGRQRERKS